MMPSVADVYAAMDGAEVPCTTLKWPQGKAPPLPYAVLVPHESQPQYSDGGINYMCRRFDIELYMRELDFALVSRLATALQGNGMGRAHARDIAVDEANQYAIAYFTLTLRE
jgi:hypothetical protein